MKLLGSLQRTDPLTLYAIRQRNSKPSLYLEDVSDARRSTAASLYSLEVMATSRKRPRLTGREVDAKAVARAWLAGTQDRRASGPGTYSTDREVVEERLAIELEVVPVTVQFPK
jgi:hypothetical protein